MSRAIIHDPEHAPGLIVRGSRHDLAHQPVKGSDATLRLTATKHAGAMDIESGQVSPGAATLVLMLDPHRPAGLANPSGMLTGSCLDTGLLVSRDHELIVLQRPAIPAALVEVQKMRPALRAKSGSRGKIQVRCCQGRIASSCSHRQIVLPLI